MQYTFYNVFYAVINYCDRGLCQNNARCNNYLNTSDCTCVTSDSAYFRGNVCQGKLFCFYFAVVVEYKTKRFHIYFAYNLVALDWSSNSVHTNQSDSYSASASYLGVGQSIRMYSNIIGIANFIGIGIRQCECTVCGKTLPSL